MATNCDSSLIGCVAEQPPQTRGSELNREGIELV